MRISESAELKDNTLILQDDFKDNDKYNNVKDCDDDDEAVDSDVDPSRLPMGMTLFKEKVIKIIKCGGFEDKRPSKLSVEELLNLLSLFNENKIYFHVKRGDGNNEELY